MNESADTAKVAQRYYEAMSSGEFRPPRACSPLRSSGTSPEATALPASRTDPRPWGR